MGFMQYVISFSEKFCECFCCCYLKFISKNKIFNCPCLCFSLWVESVVACGIKKGSRLIGSIRLIIIFFEK